MQNLNIFIKNKEDELNSLITKTNEIRLKINKFNIFIETF